MARGFMLLLIGLVHAPLYMMGTVAGPDGYARDGSSADDITGSFLLLFAESRSFPLFALLFGYGLVLATRRRLDSGVPDRGVRALVRRRGGWLMLFGLGVALLVTPIEILGAYGLAAILLAPLLTRRSTTAPLKVAAFLAPVAVLGVLVVVAFESSQPPEESSAGLLLGYGVVESIVRLIAWIMAIVINLIGYPVVICVVLGIWAARRRLLEDPDSNRRLLVRIAAIGLPIALLGAAPIIAVEAGAMGSEHTYWATVVHILTGPAGGFAYAALFALAGGRISARVAARGRAPRGPLLAGLVAVGQRSLTSYIVIETVIVVSMSGVLVGLGDTVSLTGAAGVAVAAWFIAMLLATVLHRAGKQGPAETLLRNRVNRPLPARYAPAPAPAGVGSAAAPTAGPHPDAPQTATRVTPPGQTG